MTVPLILSALIVLVLAAATRRAGTRRLMEEVVAPENLARALRRVRGNDGAPGADAMSCRVLERWLLVNGPTIREQLLAGTYRPQAVREVSIRKPSGGLRTLSIPTVLDRFVQQAILQVLAKRWDRTFSDSSFAYRPGRSVDQAVRRAARFVTEGRTFVVDLDVRRFFDEVPHARLLRRFAARVEDRRLVRLVRDYLETGGLDGGTAGRRSRGVAQGGPLSPLLSNLFLHDLDRALERRRLPFVRYADDVTVFLRTEAEARRVLRWLRRILAHRFDLFVNEEKTVIARAWERPLLGCSIGPDGRIRKSPASAKDRNRRFPRRR